MAQGGASGWNAPTVILTICSLVVGSVGSYLAIQRDDSKEVQRQLNANDRAVAILEYRVKALEERRAAPNE